MKPSKKPNDTPKLQPNSQDKGSQLECTSGNGPLAEEKGEARDTGRFLIRVTSYRNRLLDEDNLSEKYLCDLCRYSGIVPDDRPELTKIEVCQIKVPKEQERTLVEVWFPKLP